MWAFDVAGDIENVWSHHGDIETINSPDWNTHGILWFRESDITFFGIWSEKKTEKKSTYFSELELRKTRTD